MMRLMTLHTANNPMPVYVDHESMPNVNWIPSFQYRVMFIPRPSSKCVWYVKKEALHAMMMVTHAYNNTK